jgi:thiol-disulfide isomerase/thioredoxin
MKRRTLIQSAGAAALSAWGGARAAEDMPAIGTPLALPDVPLLDGSMFRAAQAQGQVVVVYWWASWCPFCALQTPHMQKLWDAQRARGLRMLGLSIDRRIEDARKYMGQRGYTFPTGFNTPGIEAVLPKPPKALPVTYVRGRDGRLVMAEKGQLFPEDIEQIARFL